MDFPNFDDLVPAWARDLVERWNLLARWARGGIIFALGCLAGVLL